MLLVIQETRHFFKKQKNKALFTHIDFYMQVTYEKISIITVQTTSV